MSQHVRPEKQGAPCVPSEEILHLRVVQGPANWRMTREECRVPLVHHLGIKRLQESSLERALHSLLPRTESLQGFFVGLRRRNINGSEMTANIALHGPWKTVRYVERLSVCTATSI